MKKAFETDLKPLQTFLVDIFYRCRCRHCRHNFTGELAHNEKCKYGDVLREKS